MPYFENDTGTQSGSLLRHDLMIALITYSTTTTTTSTTVCVWIDCHLLLLVDVLVLLEEILMKPLVAP